MKQASDNSLKSKAIKGMAWIAIERIMNQGISFIIGIVMARILIPADYGLVGMLAIFFAVANMLVDSGFQGALIQKKNRTEIDFSTIFYFNLLVSCVIYALLFFSAPAIARFYNVPQLVILTRVLSLVIIINSLGMVPLAKLNIDINFRSIALTSVVGIIISGTIGIAVAYNGYGVWALVLQTLVLAFIRSAMFIYYNRWVPLSVFSKDSLKEMFGYSSRLLGAGLINTLMNNIYLISIGKMYSAKDLGYYTKSKQFSEVLPTAIMSVFQGVSFPILSSIKDEKERLAAAYGDILGMVTFVTIPALIMLALLAEPLIRLFLTEKWVPIVPLLQWLCFARMLAPINSLNNTILNAIGRSDLSLKVDIIKIPLLLIALIITIPLGLKAVVIGHLILSLLDFLINAYYPGRLFGFGVFRQINGMKYVIVSACVMSVVVLISRSFTSVDFLQVVICTPAGVLFYLVTAYFFRLKQVKEILIILNSIKMKFIRN